MCLACFIALGRTILPSIGAATDDFERLDSSRDWLVGSIEIEGNHAVSIREIREVLLTRERKLLRPWRKRPFFDPVTFERDLERLRRLYEREGFYRAQIRRDWIPQQRGSKSIIDLSITIEEGPRAVVSSVSVVVGAEIGSRTSEGRPPAPPKPIRFDSGRDLVPDPPLVEGAPFRESDYLEFENQLRRVFLNRGHAFVEVQRAARVRRDRLAADVTYHVDPGPVYLFGPISITGNDAVAREIIRRELVIAPGESFSIDRIDESRRKLLALRLFANVRIERASDANAGAGPEVPMAVVVREKPSRELRVGVGYSTEEQARGLIRWQSDNWLGGGRQLIIGGKYSSLVRAVNSSFTQPHFFDRNNRGLLTARLFQEDERSYTRNSIEFVPGLEREFTPHFTGSLGFRIDLSQVRDVESEVDRLIGGVRDEGRMIGPKLLLRWSSTDDLFDPTRGRILTFQIEHASRIWGGTYDYYRASIEAAEFYPIQDWMVVAGRLKVEVADSIGASSRLPIFKRLYAGGERSVRGYQRRQLGPRASNGDALGGRSLVEGSVEARIPIWREFGFVGFLDFGQVSLDRFDLVPDDLRFAAGPGATYETPVGPIAFFAGFPINGQRGEPNWQLHFSIGFFF
jgi:outer membrane protein assembly complex protein YaeT